MKLTINEQQAKKELEKRYEIAANLLENNDQLKKFLNTLHLKMKVNAFESCNLDQIPMLASLLQDYVSHSYTKIPLSSILIVTSALIYFLSSEDIIPDEVPGLGYNDDVIVAKQCIQMIDSDFKEYVVWKQKMI